jgi:hypothetical protein
MEPSSVSTYETYADEERFTQMVVDKRGPDIIKWLRNAKPGVPRSFEVDNLNEVTGRSLSRADWTNGLPPEPVMGAKIVLKPDPAAPNGYYILTTYPSGVLAPTWLPTP